MGDFRGSLSYLLVARYLDPMEPPTERTFSYVPRDSVALRYAFAVAVLMLTRANPRWWLIALGLVAGSAWYAVVAVQRDQSTWWLGFVIAAVAVAVIVVVFALAVFRTERRTPTYPQGKVVLSEVNPETVTLSSARGTRQILRNEIDRSGRALGFTLLAATDRRLFLVVPSALVPSDVVTPGGQVIL